MKNIIHFSISRDGEYYIASAVDFAIVTQAKTLDELAKNIQEATELHFEGENLADFGLSSAPSVLINFELPRIEHIHA